MKKKEVIKLIGEETVLRFSFCHDGMFYFETLVPVSTESEDLHIFSVCVYTDDQSNDIFHDFNTLGDIVRYNQISEVKKIYTDEVSTSIYFKKYKSNK